MKINFPKCFQGNQNGAQLVAFESFKQERNDILLSKAQVYVLCKMYLAVAVLSSKSAKFRWL